ncbi:efflux RND transporter periplasmic adaptor subunit [Cyclobacterium amurskyense]|uniref:Efflux transporter, RND family, MFP subunit n=1 Tax=Cyclobacterium amurskyense TaxID=320787 RepID=A0A0H4PCY1_9BACT|nr:efflux RND transporter periplasmic adaptor subunit [Cyclobacterium amurskyense]AKP50693.1 Efflux transporter, RND family, MFP subunit [Cyclobacterium amurskyense]|tara:strand:+ start:29185 stop:30261 length:1077 start_codon:yes stop_codon:yes gene_type:complete
MKNQTKIILIGIILLVIGFIFFYPRMSLFTNSDSTQAESTAQSAKSNLPVEVIELKEENLETSLNITGTLIPNEIVNLRPEVAGLVEKITFQEGQFVRKGTPLLYLNDDELKAQYDRLEYTKKLYESQESRQKQLLTKEAISQEEYDIVLNQYNTNLADLRLIEAQLNKTVIKAPFDGELGFRQISEGSVIGTSDLIATIVNVDPIKIEFSIPERYSDEIKLGSVIYFRSNVNNDEAEGKVYAIEPNIDAATRTLKIRAKSANKQKKFLPGMFVRVRLVLDEVSDAILVPSESVIPELEGYKVFISRNGVVESRKVVIGQRTDTRVQLVEGVKPGELVLTTGVLQARDGMSVDVNLTN